MKSIRNFKFFPEKLCSVQPPFSLEIYPESSQRDRCCY